MKQVFIINPNAGRGGQVETLIQSIKKYFKSFEVRIEITTKKCEASVIAARYAQTGAVMHIYACGGDGTLNEVLNGIYGYDNVSLGVIPIGTGNDFIKSLEIDAQDLLDLKNYVNPQYKKVDVLSISDEYYAMNIVSVGFDVQVAKNAVKFKNKKFKNEQIPYTLALVYSMLTSLKRKYTIFINEQKYEQAYTFIVACNGGYYGGGYKPYPKARIDDGIMNVVFIQNVNHLNLPKLAKHYEKGTHIQFEKHVNVISCKEYRIEDEEQIALNVDGEIIHRKNPTIRIQEKAVQLVLPNTGDVIISSNLQEE